MKEKMMKSMDDVDLQILDEIAELAEELLMKRGMKGGEDEGGTMIEVEMASGKPMIEEGEEMEDEYESESGSPILGEDVDKAMEMAGMDDEEEEDDEFELRRRGKIY